ncbi:MAG: glutaredoxin [Candidatus Berkelbacteria bacterium]|nr:glutaredoxin [Candidatus Berkelbacteria bacterium]
MYDTIIIGAGPAGLTAAIYLIRKESKILVISQNIGGQIMDGPLIENYPGFEKITGPDFVSKLQEQTQKLGVEIKNGQEVSKITKLDQGFEIETSTSEKYQTKTVIIASGKSPRKLDVPGGKEFLGKGISSCVTCDGPLFRDKTVAVIGGGNSAISAALELEQYAQKVYIINIGQDIVGEEIRIDKIKKSFKIEVIAQAKTTMVSGSNLVEGLKYKDLNSGEEKEIQIQGVFVEIGWQPSTGYLENFITLTPAKEIKIDAQNSTNIEGVFAAGDATEVAKKQLIIAAGEGAKAALSAWDFLTNK